VNEARLENLSATEVVAGIVRGAERIAVDTEFLRERTYFAQLCLLQVATPDTIVCLDPLAGAGDQAGSWKLLADIPWVLHSGRQDIEVVYHSWGLMPTAVFDTQVAAALLGYQPQLGYAGLVSELFGVDLDKSHTRADWSRRPMSEQMLRYAAEDVEYLLPAYERLVQRLDEAGRLAWALEDSADLLDAGLYSTDPNAAAGRIKGAQNLRGTARKIAVRLAIWREREAIRSDRPRQWILKDGVIIAIAERRPSTPAELATIPGLAEKTARRAGAELLTEIRAAESEVGDYQPPLRPNESQKALLKAMQQHVADLAKDLQLAAEIIAPKKDLSAAVFGDCSGRVFRGWRRELIGGELAALLDGGDPVAPGRARL